MSSILTNSSAMVALQTLRGINKNLAQTQNEISTGKSISNARDNAAVWSIAKTMDSDVRGFKAISDTLALGSSTVAVARQAAETVTDLLTQMKGQIVAAQEQNVDRGKIQTDIVALRSQIESVVGAAQFNGLNLVDGSSASNVEILSSLDRDAAGNVSVSNIDVSRQSLSVSGPVTSMTIGTTAIGPAAADRDAVFTNGVATETQNMAPGPITWEAANTAAVANASDITLTVGQTFEGASYNIALTGINVTMQDGTTTVGSREFSFVAGANDGVNDVASALVNQLNSFFASATPPNGTGPSYAASVGDAGEIVIANTSGTDMRVGIAVSQDGDPGTPANAGGLAALQNIDVVNNGAAALDMIDGLIDKAISASAGFGSAQSRIETQREFIQNLSDALTTGIGSLVDADMEATSAKLQALQVQQQLATQSLSIANQQPQNILSLFR